MRLSGKLIYFLEIKYNRMFNKVGILMKKCPFCFEDVQGKTADDKCPVCLLHVSEKLIELDYPSVERKKCYFCGSAIAKEAKYCRFCKKWIDDVERNMSLYDDLMKD